MELEVDLDRENLNDATGIYVRARLAGKWGSYDIATLTKESLLEWLRSRGDKSPLAENVIGVMLGHGHITDPEE